MKKRKILRFIIVFVLMVCITVPTFASPYQNSHGQGWSEYQTGGHPPSGGSGAYNPTQPNTGGGGLYNGYGGGNTGGGYPGSGINNQYNGGGYPGSGSNQYNGNGYPGSGSQGSHYGGGGGSQYLPSNPTGGYPGGGSSTDEHFNASVGSDGSVSISLPGSEGVAGGDPSGAIKLAMDKYKGIGTLITGLAAITAIISLLVQITKLGAAGDNERQRAVALRGIFFSGAALAIFGSLTLVVGFFWGALNG